MKLCEIYITYNEFFEAQGGQWPGGLVNPSLMT